MALVQLNCGADGFRVIRPNLVVILVLALLLLVGRFMGLSDSVKRSGGRVSFLGRRLYPDLWLLMFCISTMSVGCFLLIGVNVFCGGRCVLRTGGSLCWGSQIH